jgi:putative flavoprotein involved in K+ transport
MREAQYTETVVVGGGQAGLAVGFHLARRGMRFLILDAHPSVGDAWRTRWDSLRLFTPGAYDGLPGMAFPAGRHEFPTKDAMADYLEAYARRFDLPVRTGRRVEHLTRDGQRFVLSTKDEVFEADNVVVAMSNYQRPRLPRYAGDLDPSIRHLHSYGYRNPAQLQPGPVLIVGAGNSGAEIAVEVARTHQTWLAGNPTGEVPFRIDSLPARLILLRLVLGVLFKHVLTVDTPIGRKARRDHAGHGMPLLRIKSKQLANAGVVRVPRTVGTRDGQPLLEDGRVLDVQNVIWCTGFEPGFTWIDLPILGPDGWPRHHKGVIHDVPGLYFVGLHFLHAASSAMVQGVGRDGERIARAIQSRMRVAAGQSTPANERQTSLGDQAVA